MNTWDPTDGEGWKRAMASSTSPTALESPAKKAKMSSFFIPKKSPSLPNSSANSPSASASTPHLLASSDTAYISSDSVEDETDGYLPSISCSYSQASPFPPAPTPVPIPVEQLLPPLTYIQPPTHPRFLFSSSNAHSDLRAHSSAYFDIIKNNAYTSGLLPSKHSPNIIVPRNGAEARELLKRGRYNQLKPEPLDPTIYELEKLLEDLRKRHASLRILSMSAGIEISSKTWVDTNTLIEHERPDFDKIVDEEGHGKLDTLAAFRTPIAARYIPTNDP